MGESRLFRQPHFAPTTIVHASTLRAVFCPLATGLTEVHYLPVKTCLRISPNGLATVNLLGKASSCSHHFKSSTPTQDHLDLLNFGFPNFAKSGMPWKAPFHCQRCRRAPGAYGCATCDKACQGRIVAGWWHEFAHDKPGIHTMPLSILDWV